VKNAALRRNPDRRFTGVTACMLVPFALLITTLRRCVKLPNPMPTRVASKHREGEGGCDV
jgi:hypothetical protein